MCPYSRYRHIEIQNFRSIKSADLDLKPLNILIGVNGGGKSNILDTFCLLSEGANGKLADGIASRGGFHNILFIGKEEDRIVFRLEYPPEDKFHEERYPITYKIELRPIGPSVNVWFERVSRGASPPHTTPLYLVNRYPDRTTFLNRELGEREEIKEGLSHRLEKLKGLKEK